METDNTQLTIDQLLSQTYNSVLQVNPKHYSIDARILKAFVLKEGALMSRTSKRAATYNLYYNEPLQIANIGFAIGNYLKSKKV